MDTEDHTKPTTPPSSGHESHGVHLCHRCGWPFPNPHPSSKHRRAHNRICGTIEGYTNTNHIMNSSEPLSVSVSDDEHHSDEDKDKDKTPSPKIEKRTVKESGGVQERSKKSEDDLFSDAVTEFSDTGISPDTTNLLDSPLDYRKVYDELKVFQTPDSHPKDAEKTEENDVKVISSLDNTSDSKPSEPLVKDQDVLDEVKFSDVVETSNTVPTKLDSTNVTDDTKKGQGEEAVYVVSIPSDIPRVDDYAETLIEDFKDHKTEYSNVPLVLRSDVVTYETKTMEVKIEESQPGSENAESVVSEHTNAELSDFVPTEVAETESLETSKTVHKSTDNLSEADVSTHKCSVVTPDESTEKINQGKLESDHEHVSEVVVEEAEVDHSVPVLAEDLASEKRSEDFTQETVKETESGIEVEQKIVASGNDDSKDTGNVGVSQRSLEKAQDFDNASRVSETLVNEADDKLILDQDCGIDASVGSSNCNSLEGNWGSVSVSGNDGISQRSLEKAEELDNASRVSETLVNEADNKLILNQDCGIDASVGSSSRNSLEGNWGSVSVLSTASIDAENAQSVGKSEEKSRLGKPDSFGGQSLVELKEETSEINTVTVQTSEPPKSEESRAGWLPNEANETEGRKRNEEAIAKVTNWSTSQPTTTPIKNLGSEAKTSNPKPLSNTIQKDEASEKISEPGKSKLALVAVNQDSSSQPKDIGEEKKGRKKGKGRASWIPFVCCSSVNVN